MSLWVCAKCKATLEEEERRGLAEPSFLVSITMIYVDIIKVCCVLTYLWQLISKAALYSLLSYN